MRFKDYYQILGVAPDATPDAIKTAYRKLARTWHPDVNRAPEATAKFAEINEANEVLGDAAKRAQYDRVRAGGWQPGDEIEPPPGTRPPPRGSARDDGDAMPDGFGDAEAVDPEAFSEFFESMFGAQARRGRARRAAPERGEDLEHPLTVTLEEAYRGGERTLVMQREDGERTLNVRIPAGVADGTRVRVRGEGGRGPTAERNGDLYLVMRLAPHPRFRADGRDIHLELPVAPWEAALGAKVATPTLGGSVELSVPAGSRDGARLRLRGRGLPGDPPGDQYVALRIAVPAGADQRQRAAWQELAESYRGFDARAGAAGG